MEALSLYAELMDNLKDKLNISVVIVTLNRAMMLEDSLISLTRQTRMPDEVVVVDNGSTDNTREIAENFKSRLNIKYVLEKRKGIPIARNTGVKNSTGEVIVFTDDDCMADKEWLHYLELPFLRDHSIGMVGGEILAQRSKGTVTEDYCIADALMRVGFKPKKEALP